MSIPLRIAVVSPFIDKRHGTERCIAEEVERLARDYGYEIHIYSQRVEDVEGVKQFNRGLRTVDGEAQKGAIYWHKVPDVPGPHLIKYLWWFFTNQVMRWWDRRFRGLCFDLVYSPGINCLDADVISVHIVFAEFYRQVKDQLSLWRNPIKSWARLLHRRIYYRLIMFLERKIYPKPDVDLIIISRKVGHDLKHHYQLRDDFPIAYHGIDVQKFNPQIRAGLRSKARQALNLPENAFALLLVGNGWKKKGLDCLLEAVGRLRHSNLWVLVVGRDDPTPYHEPIKRWDLNGRVLFLPPRPDVEFYYAAADAYVGPSLEDAFALPPAEAMACGLPVIVSSHAGVSEIVTHGVDGLILKDPRNPEELAQLIRHIYEDAELRQRLGENAAQTAKQYTWERNARQMHEVFLHVVKGKG